MSADDLISEGENVGDSLMIVADTPGANPNVMRGWIDQIRKKSDAPTAVLLAAVQGEKVLLVGGLSKAAGRSRTQSGRLGRCRGEQRWAAAVVVARTWPRLAEKTPASCRPRLEAAKASMREQLAAIKCVRFVSPVSSVLEAERAAPIDSRFASKSAWLFCPRGGVVFKSPLTTQTDAC